TSTLPVTIVDRPKHSRLSGSKIWMITAGVLAAALIGLALFSLLRSASIVTSPVVRFDVAPSNKTGLSMIRYPAVTLSPDGSTLAFLANSDGVTRLYVRRRDDTEVRMIPGTERALDATFSADGQWIAFVADFTLKKVPLNGPVVSLTKVADSRGVAWMADDSLVYTPDATGGVFQISSNGGEPRAVTKVDESKRERSHRWPQALPGGKAVLFTVGTIDKPDDYDASNIEAVILATGERKVILQGASVARYVPTGHLVFARDGVIYGVGFDVNGLTVSGKPVPLLVGVAGDKTTGAVHFAVSNDGTLAYLPGSSTSGMRNLTWVDKKGNQTPINIPPAQFNDVRISPDGSRIAVLQGSSMSGDVWVYDVARATLTRLTFTATNSTPVWSADGKYIYYASTDSSGSTILRKPADGSRDSEKIVSLNHQAFLKGILPDGQTALLDTSRQTADANVATVLLKPDAKSIALVNTPFNEYAAAASPDGRWLAYQSNESGKPEIYVRELAGSGARWPISTGGGEEPRWSANGKALYYRVDGQLMAVLIDTRSSFQVSSTPVRLFNEVYDLRSNSGQTYDVDTRGDRFLMIKPPKEDNSAQIRIVVNWFEELRKLVPTK
ncbi:MAG TPA: hypothetical protein VLB68_04040, partial [Pyrinomonadaceae bacterium]|nr:hypothetical protein [Pyrinomonadaceae bacterium]